MKQTTIITTGVVIVAIAAIYFFTRSPSAPATVTETPTETAQPSVSPAVTPSAPLTNGAISVIGKSVEGRDINAYHYGTGTSEILFIGGIHGGYEWNTVLVANKLTDYLKANPSVIPVNVKVIVIPVLNPDGLNKVVGTATGNFTAADVSTSKNTVIAGRFNANTVDLNRNFDCDWQENGKWQSTTVSGGTAVFSEPESQAIKNYITTAKPAAVIVWYSAAGGVYASNCHGGVSAETNALTQTYADASGYPAYQSFDFYSTTGDITNWLAKINIPAVSVILTDHSNTEWSKNLLGVQALLKYYGNK